MTEPDTLRVFVNGTALALPRNATVLAAVRAFDPAAALAVAAGERAVTDSQGRPISPDATLTGGAVLRLVRRAASPRRDAEA